MGTSALSIRKDLVFTFGDERDGVIGIPVLTDDGHVVEASYFYGDAKPKNIVNISSQAGCAMGCTFCELGSEKFARNLTPAEMCDQAIMLLDEAEKQGLNPADIQHKLTIANSGEPLFNPMLVEALELLADFPFATFKISTVFPDAEIVDRNFDRLTDFAAQLNRPVQIQISLISTQEAERARATHARVANFCKIREAAARWREANPNSRKINLSLILTRDRVCSVRDVCRIFPPELFHFRFRDYVPTRHGRRQSLCTMQPPRLSQLKQSFAEQGYDVQDWATPTDIEWKFGLAGNVIRRTYLEMTEKQQSLL